MGSSETRVILDETNIDSSFRNDSVVTPTSVTGKKLTNLPAVSNTSILATDSMLQAFAKLQGQINNKISSSDNAATATKLQTPRVIAIAGAVSGSATFDGSSNISINSTLNNFDAAKITSGTISIERLPKGALERLVKVANQAARFALTTADVQEGDTVQQMDTGIMYFVIDTAKLNSEAGYNIYTAGSATSVPWSGVTGRPTKLSEFTNDSGYLTSVPAQSWASITGKPTTLAGYGISDAKIASGVITLGSNSITPLTTHQSISHLLKIDGSNGTAEGLSAMINKLTIGNSAPNDSDYCILQYSNGNNPDVGISSFHRKTMGTV